MAIKLDIAVDMDGVLSDFDSYVRHLSGEYPDQLEYKDMWNIITKAAHGDGFFNKLDPMPGALELWDYLKENHNPFILSSTGTGFPELGATQKREWIDHHLGEDTIAYFVTKSSLKANYIDSNHAFGVSILIDDRSKSIDPWQNAGGVGILHNSPTETLIKLKKIVAYLEDPH
jgi:5'(3')-deoxyribonucleotidase